MTRILMILGHPLPSGDTQGHALSRAYAEGASQGGHQVRTLPIASLNLQLRQATRDLDPDDPDSQLPEPDPERLIPVLQPVQNELLWAEHIVLFAPMWMGRAPAIVHEFLAYAGQLVSPAEGEDPQAAAKAKCSVRLILTTGMPATLYRLLFRAYRPNALATQVRQLCRNIDRVEETLIGNIALMSDGHWPRRLRRLGRRAA
ncbi:MAG: hypothetical protein RJA44_1045 [Pseudomonadota bacterium]|jgi:putative NADPH-quinone reductase